MSRFVLALVLLCPLVARAENAVERIKKSGELRWAADSKGGAPYVFADPRDAERLIGFEVEIANAIAARLGVKPRFVQADYDKLLELLPRGDVDIVINGIEANDEKRRVCELSRPYYVAAERLSVRTKDGILPTKLSELKGKKAGTLPATLAARLLKEAGCEVSEYQSGLEQVYHDLTLNRIDAVLIDEPTSTFYANLEPGITTLPHNFGELHYAVASVKGDEALRKEIDAALDAMIKDGSLRTILETWALWNVETATLFGDTDTASKHPSTAYQAWLDSMGAFTFVERLKTYPRYFKILLRGAGTTLLVSVLAFCLAVPIGMSLALSRRYGPAPLRWFATAYIEVFRGTPLLVQLFFIYFALPDFGINLSPFLAGILGLAFNYAAAEAENYRAGLESVPSGQVEASWALGLSTRQAVRYVVIPQAIRVAIPPATNDFIALLKDSSLVSVITMRELLLETQSLASATRDNRGMFALCALIYLLLGLPFARLARYLELRMGAHLRRGET